MQSLVSSGPLLICQAHESAIVGNDCGSTVRVPFARWVLDYQYAAINDRTRSVVECARQFWTGGHIRFTALIP